MRYRTHLKVNLSIFENNIVKLKSLAKGCDILAMVKANGYGHGLVSLVSFAKREQGINEFGCATLGEAIRLRDELPSDEFEIYVFSDLQLDVPKCLDFYLTKRIIPVISCESDLETVLNNPLLKHLPLCLKFNTGMNRLGINYINAENVVKRLKANGRKSVYHLLSHFASSFEKIGDGDFTSIQYARFNEVKSLLKASGIDIERSSISNSGAIEQKFALHETHIRPGLIMYGLSSLSKDIRESSFWTGQNISTLETYVIRAFDVKKGTSVGYGASKVPVDGTIALIAIGYGDGFPTTYSGLELNLFGHNCKVFGRVNMDMVQLFFPSLHSSAIKEGEGVNIWSENNAEVLSIADQTGIIPYEIFCQLTVRVPRVYVR